MTRRWAVLLIGRNSVSPWMMPRTIASSSVMGTSGVREGGSSGQRPALPDARAAVRHDMMGGQEEEYEFSAGE
jgi:hypothetical protein